MTNTTAIAALDQQPHARPSSRRHRMRNRLIALTAPVTVPLLLAAPAEAAVPGVTSDQPPGTNGLNTILGWGGWVVGFLGVAGILIVAGMMVIKHQRGEGGESFAKLGMVLGGLVVGSGASLLAGAVYA